jgi:hypothetical protein
MLYFARKPDLVFTAILHAALESEGESIKCFVNTDADLREACYPESSRYFNAATCLDVLTELFCASRDPIVYRPTDYHWLLLYEVLQNFCEYTMILPLLLRKAGVRLVNLNLVR